MNIKEIIDKMKQIQTTILEFLDHEDNSEENYENLISNFYDQKIKSKPQEIRLFLHMLSSIAKNHYRYPDFIAKIEKILNYLKDTITGNFSNAEIFNFFKGNNLILLFLIEEKILKIDQIIYSKLKNTKYFKFFSPEINKFLNKENKEEEQLDDFYKKRKIGENDDFLCQLIQKDSIEDFIIHVNKEDVPLKSKITPSIFETNSKLIKTTPTLIEYAAFFGSIQIFKYLFNNITDLDTSKLWIYSVHSDNPEIINFLEENKVTPINNNYWGCFGESVKCHHINIANYIQNNYLEKFKEAESELNLFYGIINHNYYFFDDDCSVSEYEFYYLCKYDYPFLVESLLKTKQIDINEKLIKIIFLDEISY